jgi:hypothetical protein
MLVHMQPLVGPHPRQIYQIRVLEYLDDEVAAWFCPLTVAHDAEGATLLTGPVRDQAELHGVLIKIRDLNLTLIGVVKQ